VARKTEGICLAVFLSTLASKGWGAITDPRVQWQVHLAPGIRSIGLAQRSLLVIHGQRIEALDPGDGRISGRAAQALQYITGESYRWDGDKWEDWRAKNRPRND